MGLSRAGVRCSVWSRGLSYHSNKKRARKMVPEEEIAKQVEAMQAKSKALSASQVQKQKHQQTKRTKDRVFFFFFFFFLFFFFFFFFLFCFFVFVFFFFVLGLHEFSEQSRRRLHSRRDSRTRSACQVGADEPSVGKQNQKGSVLFFAAFLSGRGPDPVCALPESLCLRRRLGIARNRLSHHDDQNQEHAGQTRL